ncbi:MAG: hypothetical protein Pg6A_02060 [Termitinemataceae bacterium]|nr:MAG: hypothetical protein Pg6A_02060 [Termitinemataceae bacterium]
MRATGGCPRRGLREAQAAEQRPPQAAVTTGSQGNRVCGFPGCIPSARLRRATKPREARPYRQPRPARSAALSPATACACAGRGTTAARPQTRRIIRLVKPHAVSPDCRHRPARSGRPMPRRFCLRQKCAQNTINLYVKQRRLIIFL